MPSKAQKSKSSRGSNRNKHLLFGKIDIASPKNQYLLAITIVAVLGAGWFTFRSFAQTPALLSFYMNRCVNNCEIRNDQSTGNIPATALDAGGEAFIPIARFKPEPTSEKNNNQVNNYQVCFPISTTGATLNVKVNEGGVDRGSPTGRKITDQSIVIQGTSGKYEVICTSSFATDKNSVLIRVLNDPEFGNVNPLFIGESDIRLTHADNPAGSIK